MSDKRLGFADGSILTVGGKVRVRWEYLENTLKYTIELPQGVQATVTLADGSVHICEGGAYMFDCN